MSEHNEQVSLFRWIRANQNKYPVLKTIYAIPNGGLRKKGVAGKLKAEGVKAGVWDVHVPVRGGFGVMSEDCGLWIEMKFGKNKLTDNQKEFRGVLLEHSPHKFVVCYTWIDAVNAIIEYLGLLEEKLV